MTPRRWDKQESQRLLAARWDAAQFRTMLPILRSVTRRLQHAQYHFSESQRLIAEHIEEPLMAGTDPFSIMLPKSDEEAFRINNFFVQCEAHMLACGQAIHATGDILAHLVYYALGLNLGQLRLDERNIGLYSVCTQLEKSLEMVPPTLSLLERLTKLKSDVAFREVGDVVNHAKHRGGPAATLAMLSSEEKPYEMQFGDFFRGDHRPAKAVDELLAPAFQAVNEAVVDVGIELNKWLCNSQGA